MKSTLGTVFVTLALLLFLTPPMSAQRGRSAAAADYVISELQLLPDGVTGGAQAINDKGQIVGWSSSGPAILAVLWDRGDIVHLGALPGATFSQATDINDRGDIVGFSNTAGGDLHAVMWSDGTLIDLGHLGTQPSGNVSTANGINKRGQVVGSSTTSSGEQHAFLWQDGVMIDLGTLPGGAASIAWAINDRGQVVGVSATETEQHAFLWADGEMRDLGTLDGGTFSAALDINQRGQIVGVGDNDEGFGQAVVRERERFRDLAAQVEAGIARALNHQGLVAGEGRTTSGNTHALLWQGGTFHDLGTLPGDVSSRAWDLNDRGTIVGESHTPEFLGRAVVWTARKR
jgi:probable HAF family extracellular repeat protein